jgi:hypothetical protein
MRKFWSKQDSEDVASVSEWQTETHIKLVLNDEAFRKGIVNLAFDGASDAFLSQVLPPFELAKLSIRKLSFDIEPMIDTLVRYKEKGSYSAKQRNNAETVIRRILDKFQLKHKTGDLSKLFSDAHSQKRTMDFMIPDSANPRVVIESSYLATTSSGQGDKAKTEIQVRDLIKEHYPQAIFIGFVDGVGWYVRQGDLRRMVSAYDDVFTFHEDELLRFERFLTQVFS